jgi:hypothetical protein
MSKLTEQQIEAAKKAWANASWTGDTVMGRRVAIIKAIAPFVQLPTEEPTVEEAVSALATYDNSRACGTSMKNAMMQSLGWFVAWRNRQPKPTKRDRIICAIKSGPYVTDSVDQLADRILAEMESE